MDLRETVPALGHSLKHRTMGDLTLLYYSSNALNECVAKNFRNELLKTTHGALPIVAVTQLPIEKGFGENICVGEIGQSYYNLYRQMYAGIKAVKTKYVALTEDDSLYNMEHFSHRPSSDGVIACNKSMWFLDKDIFWTKDHAGGFAFIAATDLVRDILDKRFEKYPEEPMPRSEHKRKWLEIGHESPLGLEDRPIEYFKTNTPLVTLCYWEATSGYPKRREKNSTVSDRLDYWGSAKDLRAKILSL